MGIVFKNMNFKQIHLIIEVNSKAAFKMVSSLYSAVKYICTIHELVYMKNNSLLFIRFNQSNRSDVCKCLQKGKKLH